MIPILHSYDPISLKEMKSVRLMNRTDTKYVATVPAVLRFLESARAEYRVQEIDGICEMPYYTLYFDTPECRMYLDHLHGRLKRQKIRIRMYENSGTAFLEVKDKNNKGRTNKSRVACDDLSLTGHSDFIDSGSLYRSDSLLRSLENRFTRITLVNRRMTERMTIDLNLRFHNCRTDEARALEELAVIELKRDGRTCSPATELLRRLRIHPSGFSKYCIGMALTDEMLQRNRFKPRLRMIRKMCREQVIDRSLFL